MKDGTGKGKDKGRIHSEDKGLSNVEEVAPRRGYRATNREQAPAKGALPGVRPVILWFTGKFGTDRTTCGGGSRSLR